MFEMHILVFLACAEDAEIWCNCEYIIAYSPLKGRLALGTVQTEETKVWSAQMVHF